MMRKNVRFSHGVYAYSGAVDRQHRAFRAAKSCRITEQTRYSMRFAIKGGGPSVPDVLIRDAGRIPLPFSGVTFALGRTSEPIRRPTSGLLFEASGGLPPHVYSRQYRRLPPGVGLMTTRDCANDSTGRHSRPARTDITVPRPQIGFEPWPRTSGVFAKEGPDAS